MWNLFLLMISHFNCFELNEFISTVYPHFIFNVNKHVWKEREGKKWIEGKWALCGANHKIALHVSCCVSLYCLSLSVVVAVIAFCFCFHSSFFIASEVSVCVYLWCCWKNLLPVPFLQNDTSSLIQWCQDQSQTICWQEKA